VETFTVTVANDAVCADTNPGKGEGGGAVLISNLTHEKRKKKGKANVTTGHLTRFAGRKQKKKKGGGKGGESNFAFTQ